MLERIFLFAVVLLGSGLNLQAQTYDPFPTNDAMWRELHGGYQASTCEAYQYVITGDTLINGQTCRKLRKRGASYGYDGPNCDLGGQPYGFDEYAGAFRNDSAAQKVYFVPPNDPADTLLYDFDLALGDTLPSTYHLPSWETYVVHDIDTVSYGGSDHAIYRVDSCGGSDPLDGYAWIEGMGSNKGLIESYGCPFEEGVWTECFSVNGNTRLPSDTASCDSVTYASLAERRADDVQVKAYPTPTHGPLTLELPTGERDLRMIVRDAFGRKVSEQALGSGRKFDIRLKGPNGLYFLEIRQEGLRKASIRIVKE